MSRAEKMTRFFASKSWNGAAPNNGESAIVATISSVSKLLVSSITSMKSTMAEDLSDLITALWKFICFLTTIVAT